MDRYGRLRETCCCHFQGSKIWVEYYSEILYFVDCASLYNLVNKTNSGALFLLIRLFCYSLHVSGNYVPIIRRKYRTYATPGICHSETSG